MSNNIQLFQGTNGETLISQPNCFRSKFVLMELFLTKILWCMREVTFVLQTKRVEYISMTRAISQGGILPKILDNNKIENIFYRGNRCSFQGENIRDGFLSSIFRYIENRKTSQLFPKRSKFREIISWPWRFPFKNNYQIEINQM